MNYLFTYKARIILFSLLACYCVSKAQGNKDTTGTKPAAKADTSLTKQQAGSQLIKSDTTLVIKAGATLVHRADTTMVIDPDGSIAKKFNEMVAAQQKADQAKNGVKVDSALIKPSTTSQQNATAPPVTAPTTPVATTTGTGTVIATPVPNSDASLPKNDASQQSAANTQQSSSNPLANTTTQQSSSNPPANTTTQQSSSNPPANTTTQQSSSNPPANTTTQQQSNTSVPANATNPQTTTTDQSAAKKDDATQPASATGQPATKTDSALVAKTDTAIKKTDTIPAKKADTTIKKTDTTMMVSDTSKQQIKAENGYLEFGGPGLAISANYDARFHKERNGWGYRVGLGFFSSGGNTVFTVPFQINYLLGNHAAMLELGAGTTFLNSTGTNIGNSKWEFDKVTGFIATATIGFRYQPEHKGFNFRIGFVPILYDEGLIPAGGASIGWTFK